MARSTENAPVIAIIGLGPMGRAIGLGLQEVKTRYEIVGHDPEGDRMRVAKESGSVDRVSWDLGLVAGQADVLILTESLETTLATMGHIAPVLKPGALVTDTGPLKAPVMARAADIMPEGVSFIGGHLIARLDPANLAAGLQGATWCLVPGTRASDSAVDVIGRLVTALGAQAYFIDAQEHDALALGIGPIGFLMSAVVLRMMAASPSLRDLRRLAPPEFAHFDEASDQEATLRALIRTSPASVLPWLDGLAAEINQLREAARGGEAEPWDAFFEELADARDAWRGAAVSEAEERGAAFDELKAGSLVRDALFGRRRTRPSPSGRTAE